MPDPPPRDPTSTASLPLESPTHLPSVTTASHPTTDPLDSDTEYEDHYLVLDLTVPNPSALSTGPSTNPHVNRAAAAAPTIPLPFSKPSSASSNLRLQLLALDSDQPLLSYQNRLYTGKWTQTIGSEIHVTLPGREDGDDDVHGDDGDGRGANENGGPPRRGRNPHPRRRTGGGYYISAKESTSAASAYLGKNIHRTIPLLRGAEDEYDDTENAKSAGGGEVVAVVPLGYRVRFTPAVVKPKQRGFKEQQAMRGQFIRRLREMQIRKGEAVEDDEDGEGNEEDDEEGSEYDEEDDAMVDDDDNAGHADTRPRGARGDIGKPAKSARRKPKAKPKNPAKVALADEAPESSPGAGYFSPGWNSKEATARGDSPGTATGSGVTGSTRGSSSNNPSAASGTRNDGGKGGPGARDVVDLIDDLMPDAPPSGGSGSGNAR